MRDKIPAYGGEDTVDAIFTGKRVGRDTYIDGDGFRLHADVNGSLNIMRKEIPVTVREYQPGRCHCLHYDGIQGLLSGCGIDRLCK